MKTFPYVLFPFVVCFLFFSCTPASDTPESPRTTISTETQVSEEENAINKAVEDAYTFISFEEGIPLDYEALRAVFTPQATLYNFAGDSLDFAFIDEFIEGFKAEIERAEMKAFKEVELGGKTEYFGNIAHRISTYAFYIDGSEESAERGVNSFQLVKVDGKWLVNSIIWDVEKAGQPIPEKYLGTM